MARIERDCLTRAMTSCSNRVGNTTLELGIGRKNLWEKMLKLERRNEPGEDG